MSDQNWKRLFDWKWRKQDRRKPPGQGRMLVNITRNAGKDLSPVQLVSEARLEYLNGCERLVQQLVEGYRELDLEAQQKQG